MEPTPTPGRIVLYYREPEEEPRVGIVVAAGLDQEDPGVVNVVTFDRDNGGQTFLPRVRRAEGVQGEDGTFASGWAYPPRV